MSVTNPSSCRRNYDSFHQKQRKKQCDVVMEPQSLSRLEVGWFMGEPNIAQRPLVMWRAVIKDVFWLTC